jgi:hypothetical protein
MKPSTLAPYALALFLALPALAQVKEVPAPAGSDLETHLLQDGTVTCVVLTAFQTGGIDCKGEVGNLSALRSRKFDVITAWAGPIRVYRDVIGGRLCYRMEAFRASDVSCL